MVFDFIKKQFIDVIEWDWQDDDVLMWQYPMADNEIQNGAVLTVRDGQVAVFVDEGQVADVFTAGRYKLTTQTLPVLTNLRNWDKMFQSPFKSDVLFFNTRLQQGRKWGTAQPVTVRDAEFGMVRIRAFGMYNYKIDDVAKFYKEISGINIDYRIDQIEPQLRNLINANLANSLGSSELPFIDLAANQLQMGEEIQKGMLEHFANYGLSLEKIIVENVSLPDELQKVLDKRISMGIIGDMDAYTKYQTAESITLAAQNEGGLAGIGAGLGVGMNMGNVMSSAMAGGMGGMGAGMVGMPQQQMQGMPQQQSQQATQGQQAQGQSPQTAQPQQAQTSNQAQATTPTTQSAAEQTQAAGQPPSLDFAEKLTQLQGLLEKGLISQADYDEAKNKVIASLTD